MVTTILIQLYKHLNKLQELLDLTPKKNGFLMIGDKDSGKTTYMNCAYGALKSKKIGGFSIAAQNKEDDQLFSSIYANVMKGHYPLPTDKRTRYEFDITYKGEHIHTFSWTDYNGGMLFQQSVKEAKQFTKDIRKSSGLMLFFDSQRLAKHEIDKDMRHMIKMISSSLPSVDYEFHINIMLTKFDLLNKNQQKNFDLLIQDLTPLIDIIDGNEHIHLNIIPVSCTKGKIVNCDDALMLMMIGPLNVYKKKQNSEIQSQLSAMRYWKSEVGPINSIMAYFRGEKSAGEKAAEHELRAEILQRKLNEITHNMDTVQEDLQSRNYVGNYFQ